MMNEPTKHILQLKTGMVNNNNINVRHFRCKGLQLNQSGYKFLSKNFLYATENFWQIKECSDISNNRLVESEHPSRPESAASGRRNNRFLTTGFLENLRPKIKNRSVVAQVNINSLRNKFVVFVLADQEIFIHTAATTYILCIHTAETKLDDSFSTF